MKHRRRERGEKMQKKLLVVLAAALVAVVSIPALMQTWTSCTITMHAGTGDVADIGQFTDCAGTVPITTYDWGALSESQTYEKTMYIRNTGNKEVMLYFWAYPLGANAWIPSIPNGVFPGDCTIYFNNKQVRFDICVNVIEIPFAPCQPGLPQYDPPYGTVPCKFLSPNYDVNTNPGYVIPNGKMIKVDVILKTYNLVGGASYDFTLTFDALTTV